MNPRVEFNLNKLEENIFELNKKTNNIDFLFPVKCCNHEDVLNIIVENNFGFDISNRNEYELIKKYLKNQFLSVSGPLSYELKDCDYKNIHIVSNNLGTYEEGMGIRINFNSNKKFEFSRFGIDYKEISSEIKSKVKYIHFHNSDHKDLKKCDDICEELKNVIEEFPKLEILNIGGHLEDLSFNEGIDYLNKIRDIIPENIKLKVEVGDFLFKDVGKLFCKVVDVRLDDTRQIVTLNFSKMANQRWAYPVYINSSSSINIPTLFYGCSCCETDIYLETVAGKLKIGDELEFSNISPYSYQWNTSFNGIRLMNYYYITK
jgi:diaminopimelate decarboxylase